MPQKHPLRRPQMRALQLNSLGVGRKQRQLMRWPGCLVLRLQQQQLWAELAATATPATSAATPSTTATSAAVGLSSLTSAPGQLQLMCSGYSAIHIFHTLTYTLWEGKIYILSHLLETTLAATCSAVYCRCFDGAGLTWISFIGSIALPSSSSTISSWSWPSRDRSQQHLLPSINFLAITAWLRQRDSARFSVG